MRLSENYPPSKLQILDLGPESEVFYYPKWLKFSKSLELFDKLSTSLPLEQYSVYIMGSPIKQPRLTSWHGDAGYTYSGLTVEPKPWTPELAYLRDRLKEELGIDFNSVLANYYQDGNSSIGWHADREEELGPTETEKVIASVSLGGMREFGIRNRKLNKSYTFGLEDGSLLIMAGETQKHCQHCIFKTKDKVKPRLNLTFRVLMSNGR